MAIRWDKLTLKSQEAMEKASSLAAENGNPELLPLHLLASLLGDSEGVIVPVLEKIGVSTPQLLSQGKPGHCGAAQGFRGEHPAGPLLRPAKGRGSSLQRGGKL